MKVPLTPPMVTVAVVAVPYEADDVCRTETVWPAVTVPALSIQPLVENAIRHGIERRPDGGVVEIAVTTTPDTVVVRIINPLASGGENRPGHHVGLNASQVRIEALTGGRGSVLTQQEGRRFIATVRLPVG